MDKIICLGKNYPSHTKEMSEAQPERPVLFLKPPSVLCAPKNNSTVMLPFDRGEIHHEVEVVFKLYKKNIIGLCLGLDLTLRDEQLELKKAGHPWEKSKVFIHSAIITPIIGQKDFPGWFETPFTLSINGKVAQQGQLKEALLDPNQIIHYVDQYFPLRDGDLIFTGTPSGVGPLKPHDLIELSWGPIQHTFKTEMLYEQT